MPRATSAPARLKRRKKIMKRAEGYWGARHKCTRVAREAVAKADEYATRDRRTRKRDMRRLWIVRLNAACRLRGMRYSQFINALKKANIQLNRKMLSEIAIYDPAGFDNIVEKAKAAL